MIGFWAGNPWASAPQIMEHLLLGGPWLSKKGIFYLVGCPFVCKQTCKRMGAIRWASGEGRLAALPPDAEEALSWAGGGR